MRIVNGKRRTELVKAYVSPKKFGEICNPSMQFKLRERGADWLMCREMEKAPKMYEVRELFGIDTLLSWVGVLLDNLNDYCGVKEKMSKEQKDEVAHIIACEFSSFNVAEVSLIFMRIKDGMAGEFYGCIEPIKFMQIFRKVVDQRKDELGVEMRIREEKRKRLEREEWKKHAMPIEDVERMMDEGKLPNLKALGGLDVIMGRK